MLDCPTVDNFSKIIQLYVDKVTNEILTHQTGKVISQSEHKNPLGSRTIDLVNWTLTLAH